MDLTLSTALAGAVTALLMILPGSTGRTNPPPARTAPDHIIFASGAASLEPLSVLPGYRLSVTMEAYARPLQLHIPYPVYRFDAADVNADGSTDILVGVIKKTHFDPVERRRLFIYRITDNGIAPLWLGSRVCRELVDFRATREGTATRVLTIERTAQGMYCNGLYMWHSFGLELIRYSTNGVPYGIALEHFNYARGPHRI
jgi:hypothetical protein